MPVGASRLPFIWCVVITLTFGTAFRAVRWSYVDTAVNISAAGDTRSWHEFFSDVLTKSVEYRPLLDVGTRVAYRILGLNLGAYQAIVILQFALILLTLAAIFDAKGVGVVSTQLVPGNFHGPAVEILAIEQTVPCAAGRGRRRIRGKQRCSDGECEEKKCG